MNTLKNIIEVLDLHILFPYLPFSPIIRKMFKTSSGLKFIEEELFEKQGYNLVAGVDEVGRGCLAGPVVASAVIIPRDWRPRWFKMVRDSKLLTAGRREYLSGRIHEVALTIGTGWVSPDLIDNRGMTWAVRQAMKIAIRNLLPPADGILIDYLTIPDLSLPQKGVENGDTLCFSIACASIVAKVFRDHLMLELDKKYPGYGLARNKGYGTEDHVACLRKLGPSAIHRLSFQPVRNVAQLSFENFAGGEE
jgi:ribonuclease HII